MASVPAILEHHICSDNSTKRAVIAQGQVGPRMNAFAAREKILKDCASLAGLLLLKSTARGRRIMALPELPKRATRVA